MGWRGFGFVYHSRTLFCRVVPNPNITIRNFCIAVRWYSNWLGAIRAELGTYQQDVEQRTPLRPHLLRSLQPPSSVQRRASPLELLRETKTKTPREFNTNCTTPSLAPTVNGNTVRNFPTHGQLSAAQGSPTTVPAWHLFNVLTPRLCDLMVRRWRLIGYFPILNYPGRQSSALSVRAAL
jgi:hypothetical protein